MISTIYSLSILPLMDIEMDLDLFLCLGVRNSGAMSILVSVFNKHMQTFPLSFMSRHIPLLVFSQRQNFLLLYKTEKVK